MEPEVRSRLTCLWGLGLLAALAAAAAVALFFALPREPVYRLGRLEAFLGGPPRYLALEPDLSVYVVDLGGRLVVWDAKAPVQGPRCIVRWVPFHHRFEDPCTGGKWCLDGRIADPTLPGIRELDALEVRVTENGEVRLYPWRRTPGPPLEETTPVPPWPGPPDHPLDPCKVEPSVD